MIQLIAFYLFATLCVAAGALTILARNPVHSVLWLIVAFFNAAGLMVLCGAEFIAMLLVIVYVGAVAVLFLFVVMMLDIDFAELRAGFIRNFPLGFALALVLLMELVLGVGAYRAGSLKLGTPDGSAAAAAQASNIEAIGAAGLVLLVAMIGAIVLTHRQRGDVRGQNIAKQVARRPDEATHNVKPDVGKGVSL